MRRTFIKSWAGLFLAIALIASGCSPRIVDHAPAAAQPRGITVAPPASPTTDLGSPQSPVVSPTGSPVSPAVAPPQHTATAAALPTVRETALALPAGLVMEEYALREAPGVEPVIFTPQQGSQAAILARRAAERSERFPVRSFFEQMHFSMRLALRENELVATEYFNQDGSDGWVSLRRNGDEIYRVGIGPGSPINALRGLWTYYEHWVLETVRITRWQEGSTVYTRAVGQLSQDGELLNERLGYDEMFGFQTIAGRPFYFFRQDGKIGFSYDGQAIEAGYAEIPHYGCCSAGALNPVVAQNMIAFFARRNGTWFYVEIGVYA